jgi:hypothetical protein
MLMASFVTLRELVQACIPTVKLTKKTALILHDRAIKVHAQARAF